MLVSYTWLNEYFGGKLPKPADLAQAITMHAFEIESIEGEGDDAVLDVKVLPNRAHDCLSYRGIAREIGAILDMHPVFPSLLQPHRTPSSIDLDIQSDLCVRCMFCRISNVAIGPSPAWLSAKLESMGSRSITDIVDVTNYAMFETGQPMHAFDLDKLVARNGRYRIGLKAIEEEAKITVLGGKEVSLPPGTLVFTDENREGYDILDIAGMKGGTLAEVDASTKNIALTAANFDPSYIRRSSKMIGIATDATKRNENGITPELALIGMEVAIGEILKLYPEATVEDIADVRNQKSAHYKLGVSAGEVNRLLGTEISGSEIEEILKRFGFDYQIVEPRETLIAAAKQHIGKPYRLGASVSKDAPNEFDCSSLTAWLSAQAGIRIPRISVDQYVWSDRISEAELKPGDLVFANSQEGKIHYETVEWLKGTKVPEGVDHVGLYEGDGYVIHATRKQGGVVEEKLSESESFKNIVGYGRIVRDDAVRFVIAVPDERLDLRLKEDLIEEIGRVYGYGKIPTRKSETPDEKPAINKNFQYAEKIRDALLSLGFSEVYTYAFQNKGEVELANPLASDKKFLRSGMEGIFQKAIEFNVRNADLLGLDEIKIFEIGKVFGKSKESTSLTLGIDVINLRKGKDEALALKLHDALEALGKTLGTEIREFIRREKNIVEIDLDALVSRLLEPISFDTSKDFEAAPRFKSISPYPFVLRDIAVWVPDGVQEADVLSIVTNEAGILLVTARLFDVFSKDVDGAKKTSYAFRLVFQSDGKTLTDEEVNEIMDRVTQKLNAHAGWAVR